MAQFHKTDDKYVDRNNDLFDVVMQSDENGELWNTRSSKSGFNVPKTVADFSLFHAMFSYGILSRIWEEIAFTVASKETYSFPAIELSGFTYSSSQNQMLHLTSGTTQDSGSGIRSKRHMLYQPDRGMIFSSVVKCPDKEKHGIRNWGLSLPYDCIRFQLEGDGTDWEIHAFQKTNNIVTLNEPLKQYLDDDFDPSMVHHYSIQFSLAGNAYFFIDHKLVYSTDNINKLNSAILPDPALPVVIESITYEEGTEIILNVISVGISTEGGTDDIRIQGSVSTLGFVDTINTGTAVLAVKVPRFVDYNSLQTYYSRAITLNKVVSWCRDESSLRVYLMRDTYASNLDALPWLNVTDSKLQYIVGGSASVLQTAFAAIKNTNFIIASEFQDIELKNEITSQDERNVPYINPGDYLIFEVIPVTSNKNASLTFYYSEIR